MSLLTRWRKPARPTVAATYKTWWDQAGATQDGMYATTYVVDNEVDYRSRGLNGDANSFGARQFIEIAGLDRSSRVLEIGCGSARVGREMAPHVAEWHGADIAESMLEFARKRTEGLANVHLHRLEDVSLAEFRDDSLDFVYSTTVFMHLDKEDLFQYLVEAHRVLRPGGVAYFDTWNLLNPDTYRQWRSSQSANHGQKKSRGRIQFTTAEELRAYLDDVGFEVLRFDEDKLLRVYCTKVPVRLHAPDDGLAPFGYVDLPRNEELVQRELRVWGWVLDDVRTIEVILDRDRKLGTASTGLDRPDVAPLFPRYPTAAQCGYSATISLDGVEPGRHTVQVVAVDGSGRRTDLAGVHLGITVER